MKVGLTESAFKDLANTLHYYEEQGLPVPVRTGTLKTRVSAGSLNPEGRGLRMVAEILHKSERLAKYPESGRIVPEFGVPFLRELIVPPFRLVYKIEPKNIWIIRVWRSERLLKLD
jgi:plasmid stabilization system protein ParE